MPVLGLRLQRWAAPDSLLETHELSPAWFPNTQEYTYLTPTTPASSRLVGLWPDATGSVWLVVEIADPNWPRALGPGQRAEGCRTYYPFEHRDSVYNTMIAQYDPVARRIALERELSVAITQAIAPWTLVSMTEGADGFVQAHLWRVRVGSPE